MKLGWMAVMAAAVLLGGCTDADWNNAMSYVGLANASPKQAAAMPAQTDAVAAAPAPAAMPAEQSARQNWCQAVAKSSAETAASEGFDGATQKNRARVMYRQCMDSDGSNFH